MAMMAAWASVKIWGQARTKNLAFWKRSLVGVLIGWNVETCLRASPDFLAYFNEAASAHASYFLVDSDLDWGQDIRRLSAELKARHVRSVSIMVLGTADLNREGLPEYRTLQPWTNPGGWIAVSEYWLKEGEGYRWLEPYPYIRVGKSIRLCQNPAGVTSGSGVSGDP